MKHLYISTGYYHCFAIQHLWLTCNMLLLCGDVELDLGPTRILQKKLSVCRWNFNSIAAHNFEKLVLLKAYNSIHKSNVICLSETYLD